MPTCSVTGQQFTVSPAEQEYCQQNGIPLPTIAPFERLRLLSAWRNRVFLYDSICDFSKKPVLSCFPPERGLKVYDVEIWSSDVWDPMSFGREYDFNRPFFEQFADLFRQVPFPNLANIVSTMENSHYTNGITSAKNCYLIFSSSYNEDCLFSQNLRHSRNIIDSAYAHTSELCYECRNVQSCYHLLFSEDCTNCSDSYFLSHCQSCKNCFGCVNLNNKEYCINNRQYTKEEYFQKIGTFQFGSYTALEKLKAGFATHQKKFPLKSMDGKSNERASGNRLNRTKNASHCYFVSDAEDVEYCISLNQAKNCFFQFAFGNNTELVYNCITVGDNSYNVKFSRECWPNARDLEYCMFTGYGSMNCFGCVGVKKKEYCILNKQYGKEEYFDLLSRIKKHMLQTGEYGRFFPPGLSPFYYNQSDASFYFPLSRGEAVPRGFTWKDEQPEEYVSNYTVPDHIKDVGDDILNEVLRCEKTGKKFKIIKPELEFYRKNNLPIPRIAPLERIKERAKIFQILPLLTSACSQCGKAIETVYDTADRKVYCEECYLREVY